MIKKLLSLLLCLSVVCCVLVSCEDEIGEEIKNGTLTLPDNSIAEATIDFYMITDETTSENAIATMSQYFNTLTKSLYNTNVVFHFYTADEYESNMKTAVDNGTADIVLINSTALMKEFMDAQKLADISEYINGAYITLNSQINEALFQASMIDGKYYSVPNNRVVGMYQYLIIDKGIAKYYGYVDPQYHSSYEATEGLRNALTADGKNPDDYVKLVYGKYEDRFTYQNDFYWSVVVNPNACGIDYDAATADQTTEEVFASAWAIPANCGNVARAMEIIYAVNTNETLRNYLQYGVEIINYTLNDIELTDEEAALPDICSEIVVRTIGEDSTYIMNIEYTGNVFLAYVCQDLGHNAYTWRYGQLQNEDAFVKTVETDTTTEPAPTV